MEKTNERNDQKAYEIYFKCRSFFVYFLVREANVYHFVYNWTAVVVVVLMVFFFGFLSVVVLCGSLSLIIATLSVIYVDFLH